MFFYPQTTPPRAARTTPSLTSVFLFSIELERVPGEASAASNHMAIRIYGLQKHYRRMVARRKYNFSLAELIRAEERDGGLKDERVARQQRYTTSLDAKFAGRFRPGACTPLTPRSAPASHLAASRARLRALLSCYVCCLCCLCSLSLPDTFPHPLSCLQAE